ncbi:hypothetical protein [Alkalicoccus chagannorensis]|uniref:hypothetical protein n=1 Tax=Alkalicoccus chagannorensis TaxID=427072 RepID=UPI00047D9B11|nr:hypothetical protein [Alkalicoccus chagannorensis]
MTLLQRPAFPLLVVIAMMFSSLFVLPWELSKEVSSNFRIYRVGFPFTTLEYYHHGPQEALDRSDILLDYGRLHPTYGTMFNFLIYAAVVGFTHKWLVDRKR